MTASAVRFQERGSRLQLGRRRSSVGAEAPTSGRARLAGAAELDELQPRPRKLEQPIELVGVPFVRGLVPATCVGLHADLSEVPASET